MEADLDNLNGAQIKAVIDVITVHFTLNDLTMLFVTDLNMNIQNFITNAPFPVQVFQIVKGSQQQGFGTDLITAIENARPNVPRVQNLRVTLGLLAPTGQASAVSGGLEKLVRDRSTTRDFGQWLGMLTSIQAQTCRVEGSMFGTGLLVGDDLVLTNYHVIEDEHKGVAKPAQLCCRFDYSSQAGSDRAGREVKLAADWLVAHAPYARGDAEPSAGAPTPADLDFALLRLAEKAGRDQIGDRRRGTMPVSAAASLPKEKDVVFIVQHPRGTPLAMASGVITPSQTNLRLRYDANTEEGSSGSGVFDASLALVALHHAGDPAWGPKFNQGIPIGLIANALKDTLGA